MKPSTFIPVLIVCVVGCSAMTGIMSYRAGKAAAVVQNPTIAPAEDRPLTTTERLEWEAGRQRYWKILPMLAEAIRDNRREPVIFASARLEASKARDAATAYLTDKEIESLLPSSLLK